MVIFHGELLNNQMVYDNEPTIFSDVIWHINHRKMFSGIHWDQKNPNDPIVNILIWVQLIYWNNMDVQWDGKIGKIYRKNTGLFPPNTPFLLLNFPHLTETGSCSPRLFFFQFELSAGPFEEYVNN